jgi:predicted phage terminase large subunit-like protein
LHVLIALLMGGLTIINANRLELFAAQYMPQYMIHRVAPFHHDWTTELCGKEPYLYFEAGRGSAKSTWCSVINGCFQGVESKNPELHLISQSGGPKGLSTKIMRLIKREFERNQLLRYDYHYECGRPWGNEHIQIVRADGSTFDIYSRGKGCSIRGARGDVLIDDPQDKLDCESETVLKHDEEWFFTDVLPVMLPGNRLIFVATPISPLSLASKVKQLPGFKVLSAPLENPIGSGQSAWPEQYPDDFIAERKLMMGVERFNAEYNCQPTISGNPVFRPEWFKSYDPHTEAFRQAINDGLFYVVGMDCAESKSTQADRTAIITLATSRGEAAPIYVVDVRAHHWSTKEGAEQTFLLFDQYQQHKTVVESRVSDKFGGDAMVQEIRAREKAYGKWVNLYPTKPVSDKVTRAMQIQSLCQQGRVYVNRLDKMQQELLSELTMFTGDQNYHDDCVDAFVMAMAAVKDRGAGKRPEIRSELQGAWA